MYVEEVRSMFSRHHAYPNKITRGGGGGEGVLKLKTSRNYLSERRLTGISYSQIFFVDAV